jgi:hypothetical protein
MVGSHSSYERDVTNGHIWGTCTDYIPNVNRMFLLGKCWTKCLNACNVLSMFPLKSRYPRPQCVGEQCGFRQVPPSLFASFNSELTKKDV